MATGYNHTPVRPSLPGLEGIAGQLVLASDYRNGSQFAGRDVLVVRLPTRVVDRVAAAVARMTTPDLTAYGLPRPDTGLLTRVVRDGAIPVQDVGIIDAILSGRVEPVAAIREIDGPDVVLADGSRTQPDTLVLATGYRRGLEPLVGHLDVLDGRGRPVVRGGRNAPGAPGLYFTGFTNPISGMLREIAIGARKIALSMARSQSWSPQSSSSRSSSSQSSSSQARSASAATRVTTRQQPSDPRG